MPFILTDQLKQIELFPQALSRIVTGEQIMLSFLEMEMDCIIPEHSHPHEQVGLVLSGKLRNPTVASSQFLGVSADPFTSTERLSETVIS